MKNKDILELLEKIQTQKELKKRFQTLLIDVLDLRSNPLHPLVFVNGTPHIGKHVYIGLFSEVNAQSSDVFIGDHCDISSFVAINCADSHQLCIGHSETIDRKPIVIEHHVFVGSHSVIKGGAHIGHHCVISAGTIVDGQTIAPYSLVSGNPMKIKAGYYQNDQT